ncbi:polysaccharide deacetylase family protein [Flavobacterium amniphilum]|uniref:polysaccharide deacetylase family protein n=1 Tax=Flavobacterium amniphilum TaxID=1834035 RepID=UPI00202A17E5|nr:polysaccharide deacetylase family protein [Flavobacterium amniphilum]MCL9806482.1 polysaccharide deacetylase family protein [Flavobacterium amniphilum]
MFYWIKTNNTIKWLFRSQIWSIPNPDNKIYLTFDDGPTPEVTEWVLNILKEENIPATFFCIGKNIENHPDIFRKIIQHGHAIGNHTFNHLNGWKTKTSVYLQNIEQCEASILCNANETKAKLFRPPYGKVTIKQSAKLRNQGYKIIMWDILTADFDKTVTPENCLKNATRKVENGSIIVFHDSLKARKNLEYALPKAIKFLKEKGFVFATVQSD